MPMSEIEGAWDIGYDVQIRYVGWSPDRELNPQYKDIPDVEKYVVFVQHKTSDGELCSSAATLESELSKKLEPTKPMWRVESWNPLTLSPSLLCRRCGHHGFIKDGKWVPA